MSIVQAPPRSLAQARPGRFVCGDVYATGENAVRLKRLGICQGRTIELLAQRDPMILRIGDSRVGLSRQLAELVAVTPADGFGIEYQVLPVSSPVAAY